MEDHLSHSENRRSLTVHCSQDEDVLGGGAEVQVAEQEVAGHVDGGGGGGELAGEERLGWRT